MHPGRLQSPLPGKEIRAEKLVAQIGAGHVLTNPALTLGLDDSPETFLVGLVGTPGSAVGGDFEDLLGSLGFLDGSMT